jgi:large subunit ribosomal protein L9
MKVILLEKVANFGGLGSLVNVKDGFARNFLFPQKKALRATKENLEKFESRKAHWENDNNKRKKDAEKLAKKMQNVRINIIRQAGDGRQLFGSVRATDVAKALIEAGWIVNKNQVFLDVPIKMLGLYEVHLKIHPEVSLTIKMNVVQTEEEAQTFWEKYDAQNSEEKKEPSLPSDTALA